MKPVKQEDLFGCGVACVAFILNISYQDSLTLFTDGESKAKEEGFLCKEIIAALEKKRLKYQYKYLKARHNIYNSRTIVFLKRSKRYPAGHYLCKINGKWMDPWINFPNVKIKAGFRNRLPGKPIYAIFESI